MIYGREATWVTYYLTDGYWNSSLVSEGELLDLQDLPPEMRAAIRLGRRKPRGLKGISRGSAELIEKRTIIDALAKTSGNVTHAAKELGISRATLQSKMKAYGLRATKA